MALGKRYNQHQSTADIVPPDWRVVRGGVYVCLTRYAWLWFQERRLVPRQLQGTTALCAGNRPSVQVTGASLR